MNQKVDTLSQTVNGDTATVVTQVTYTITEQDIVQKNQQLIYQQVQIKQQIRLLTSQYNAIAEQIKSNNELLEQFETPEDIQPTT